MNELKLDEERRFGSLDIQYRSTGFILTILGILFLIYVALPLVSFENLLPIGLTQTFLSVTGLLLMRYGVDAKYL